jgi:hypothetical protein
MTEVLSLYGKWCLCTGPHQPRCAQCNLRHMSHSPPCTQTVRT